MKKKNIPPMIIALILGFLVWKWQLDWWKAVIIYTLGLMSFTWSRFLLSRPEQTNGKIGEAIETMYLDLQSNIAEKPVSVPEILDYMNECIVHCREHNL